MRLPTFSWKEIPKNLLVQRFLPGEERESDLLTILMMFLTPFTVIEAALGFWRLGNDLGWAGLFFINRGLLSHWQVWFALAAFTQITTVSSEARSGEASREKMSCQPSGRSCISATLWYKKTAKGAEEENHPAVSLFANRCLD